MSAAARIVKAPTPADDEYYLDAIAVRMAAETASCASDAEIERTLRPCVCGKKLIPIAKRLRARGLLRPALTRAAQS